MADHKLAASTTQWPSPHVIFALVKRRAQLSGEIEAAHEGLRKIFSENRRPLFRIMRSLFACRIGCSLHFSSSRRKPLSDSHI
jgi:hypothetical protein